MKKSLSILFISLICMGSYQKAFAHAGHDNAPGDDSGAGSPGGPITITEEAEKNLKLETSVAGIRTLDKTTTVIGEIESIPNKTAAVTSRIPGRVALIMARDGAHVKKGDPLVDVESRLVGDPPPHVQYTAPIDGIILDRHAVQGETVEPDKHLLEIADLSEVYAEGRIYEGQFSLIKTGQPVRVFVESYPNETFSGKIELISGALDPETRTLRVWVRIANADLRLRPNMRATLNIVTAESDSAIAIPHGAVLGEAGNYFVFVQSDTDPLTFERRAVVTGIKDDQFIEISEGVFPGDKVVTTGNYQLQYVTSKKVASHTEAKPHQDTPTSSWSFFGIIKALALIAIGAILSLFLTKRARN